MVGLHGVEVVSIVLFQISHPDPIAIAPNKPGATVTMVQRAYRFIGQMSYVFFPLLAVALASPIVIADLP